jgi:NADH dehydrogenase
LKTLADAVTARKGLFTAFERAEIASHRAQQTREMTVIVVGGGPAGVAITGSISEFVRRTLPADSRNINVRRARIVLVEAGPRQPPCYGVRVYKGCHWQKNTRREYHSERNHGGGE